jgi:BirA family transcriptional regulator, biotin operon repressor / biotin---[acetyl-CoA-carboxylase] ligase
MPDQQILTGPDFPTLDLNFVRQQLAHSPIGHTLAYHTTVPSTMPIATEWAKAPDTPSGMIVVAEEQTSGRGRRGRSWQAPYASALLVSFILKPPHVQLPATTLPIVAGSALLAAVAEVAPELTGELRLKWPNDLVVGPDPATARKVAGILAESSLQSDGSIAYAVMGIGVNVNQRTSHLPRIAPPTPRPTSLRIAADRVIDRGLLLVRLCQQLSEGLTLTPAESYQRWKTHLATLGQTVAVYPQGPEQPPTLIGQAVNVQADGALVVEDTTGAQHIFHAADVSVRAVSGSPRNEDGN